MLFNICQGFVGFGAWANRPTELTGFEKSVKIKNSSTPQTLLLIHQWKIYRVDKLSLFQILAKQECQYIVCFHRHLKETCKNDTQSIYNLPLDGLVQTCNSTVRDGMYSLLYVMILTSILRHRLKNAFHCKTVVHTF